MAGQRRHKWTDNECFLVHSLSSQGVSIQKIADFHLEGKVSRNQVDTHIKNCKKGEKFQDKGNAVMMGYWDG